MANVAEKLIERAQARYQKHRISQPGAGILAQLSTVTTHNDGADPAKVSAAMVLRELKERDIKWSRQTLDYVCSEYLGRYSFAHATEPVVTP